MFRSALPSVASSPFLRAAFPVSPTTTRATPPPLRPSIGGHSFRKNSKYSCKSFGMFLKTRSNVSCAVSMADGQAGDSGKFDFDHIKGIAKKYRDQLPEPVKIFPWNLVMENFVKLVLGLTVTAIKYLSVPSLAVASISELSYCAHERKLWLLPIPLIMGFAVCEILRATTEELFPLPKDAVAPWDLIALAIFFSLLKLPGPYYPYWGRIFIPHFANGGLLGFLWFVYLHYERAQNETDALA